MDTEIELKYLVSDDNIAEKVSQLITDLNLDVEQSSQATKVLTNHYFDTPDLSLRKQDIGLRIRSNGTALEQTIKTAGKVVGGLHQRPEYNVAIDQHFPNLSLFPSHIWSSEHIVEDLQTDLISLFSTDFTRQIWLITLTNGAKIELVYDSGSVSSQASGELKSEAIAEIELELVTGEVEDLLTFAHQLLSRVKVRPGIHSKAARGYRLAQGQVFSYQVTPLPLVELNSHGNLVESFAAGLDFSLQNLQQLVDVYIAQPSLTYLDKISEILALLRHGFWLFDDYLSEQAKEVRDELSYFVKSLTWVDNAMFLKALTKASGNYRKKIEYSQQLIEQLDLEKRRFPEPEQVLELFYSERFNQLQLSLLALLVQQDALLSDRTKPELEAFASQALQSSLDNLLSQTDLNAPMNSEAYLVQRKHLVRSLLTGCWFGSLFDKEARLTFRNPWLDIEQGISELQTLWILQQQLNSISDKPAKLANWLSDKVDGLLLALNSSLNIATKVTPYWRL